MTARWALVLAASFGVWVSAQQQGTAPAQQQVYRPGPGIVNPVVLKETAPKYRAEAMRAGIEGVVELEGVVQTNGTFSDIRIVRSLDDKLGLDEEAIAAAKRWLFRPGLRNGEAVPVMVRLMLEFRLHPGGTPQQQLFAPVTFVPGDDFYTDAYPLTTPALVKPILRRPVQPKYTAEAMRAKIQGVVEVEALVRADGTVGRTRVTTPLDPQLDNSALEAANQWFFEAATLNGQPVPVVVKLTLEFRIH